MRATESPGPLPLASWACSAGRLPAAGASLRYTGLGCVCFKAHCPRGAEQPRAVRGSGGFAGPRPLAWRSTTVFAAGCFFGNATISAKLESHAAERRTLTFPPCRPPPPSTRTARFGSPASFRKERSGSKGGGLFTPSDPVLLLAESHKQQMLAEHRYFLLTGYCSPATSGAQRGLFGSAGLPWRRETRSPGENSTQDLSPPAETRAAHMLSFS